MEQSRCKFGLFVLFLICCSDFFINESISESVESLEISRIQPAPSITILLQPNETQTETQTVTTTAFNDEKEITTNANVNTTEETPFTVTMATTKTTTTMDFDTETGNHDNEDEFASVLNSYSNSSHQICQVGAKNCRLTCELSPESSFPPNVDSSLSSPSKFTMNFTWLYVNGSEIETTPKKINKGMKPCEMKALSKKFRVIRSENSSILILPQISKNLQGNYTCQILHQLEISNKTTNIKEYTMEFSVQVQDEVLSSGDIAGLVIGFVCYALAFGLMLAHWAAKLGIVNCEA